jgi:hypothetical protein
MPRRSANAGTAGNGGSAGNSRTWQLGRAKAITRLLASRIAEPADSNLKLFGAVLPFRQFAVEVRLSVVVPGMARRWCVWVG